MLTWRPNDFKKKLISELAENAEIVGKFVETDARQRLLAIKDPAWGLAYRSKLVSRLLGYTVEVKPNEVVITVGVRPSSEGRHHGFYIEMGSKTAPAHPYLRPAVFMNAAKILALLRGK
ncbi:MAG: hypothetical protein A2W25_05185 [candidate division Zixibacteria bacterium RBG_16_53_22]|nr:MAG: hypothetical protein A2W25_05185 [candidate division Zixibacteria bacterium RBG_16_53_22]